MNRMHVVDLYNFCRSSKCQFDIDIDIDVGTCTWHSHEIHVSIVY